MLTKQPNGINTMKIKRIGLTLCLIGCSFFSYSNEVLVKSQSSSTMEYCQRDECKLYFNEFKKAAKKGHAGAMATLGQFYYTGYGTEPDELKAITYLKKASRYANAAAQYKLGLIYLISKKHFDLDAAVKYLNKAAKKNYKDANLLLGTIYYNNQYTPQNFALADKYLSKSYQQRHQKIPTVIRNIKASVSLDESNFPLLFQKLIETPLVVGSNGVSQWPEDEMEMITITSPPLTQLLNADLISFRRAITTTGSRIPGLSCSQTIGCIQTSLGAMFSGDFPPSFMKIN